MPRVTSSRVTVRQWILSEKILHLECSLQQMTGLFALTLEAAHLNGYLTFILSIRRVAMYG